MTREQCTIPFTLRVVTGPSRTKVAMASTGPSSNALDIRNLVAGFASESGGLVLVTRCIVRKLLNLGK